MRFQERLGVPKLKRGSPLIRWSPWSLLEHSTFWVNLEVTVFDGHCVHSPVIGSQWLRLGVPDILHGLMWLQAGKPYTRQCHGLRSWHSGAPTDNLCRHLQLCSALRVVTNSQNSHSLQSCFSGTWNSRLESRVSISLGRPTGNADPPCSGLASLVRIS